MLLQLPSFSRVPALVPTTPQGASAGAELFTSDGRQLALVASHLRGELEGGLGRLVLEQQFHNDFAENLKVTYRMPLPADGAVSGYEFVIGERTIKGVVDRKAAARDKFERAIASGRTAALLEQERADIFTQQIGNIPPGETLTARITIDQRLAWLPEGEWEMRFPTVIGPRYIGSADSAADVRATHIKVTDQPLKVRVSIELSIKDAIVGTASSPSHTLRKRGDGMIELASGARLDRDVVVRWPVATPSVGLSLAAARLAKGGDAYGLLTIVPPAKDAKPVAVPRDLIVLLDTSGSMGGGPLEKAKQVVAMMIDSLDEQDRLELIEFSNEPRRYLDEPVTATAKAKAAAIKWVRSRQADGGTEMRAGVMEALQTLRVGALRQVVIVTDGYVGGEQQILDVLLRKLPKSCRLHVLGVGDAVNRSLATSLARAGRGAEVIVGVDEDAERGAKRLLDRTRMPIVTNVEITGSALLRHAPEQVPDVYEGAPIVAALALKPEGGELVVRGQLARDTWEQRIAVPAKQPGEGNQAIAALYGRERVADVESHALFSSVDGEIEDLGLEFQIATRMTSWVAVDETRIVTGPSREQLIPQELPHGTSAQAFGLRAPASAMRTMAGMAPAGAAQMMQLEESFGDASISPPAEYDDDEYAASAPAFDTFEGEEPTGMRSRNAGIGGGGAPRPTQAAPAPASLVPMKESAPEKTKDSRAEPAAAKPKPVMQPAVPKTVVLGLRQAPRDLEDKATLAPEPQPAPMKKSRKAFWWLAVLIAVIAALLAWWLA